MARILCFMGEITIDFQSELMQAFSIRAAEYGHEIVFCIGFDTDEVNSMHGEIERKIIDIPCVSDYDGIVICPDTFGIDGMTEELCDYIAENAKCPVISIRAKDDRFYNVLLEDDRAIFDMVEHFITVHHFTRICFMTGRMELEDARRRLGAYKAAMAKHGLEVNDGMVFEGDYWRRKGEEAVYWFFHNGLEPPQAIVCANDYMAISVCNALHEHHLRVPEDICVSGFDGIDEARCYMPPISSVSASANAVCDAALSLLNDLLEGKPCPKNMMIPLNMEYRNSCGCQSTIDFESYRSLSITKEACLAALHFCPYIGLDFETADTVSELFYIVYQVTTNRTWGSFEDFGTLYFCFCDESERQDNLVEMAGQFTQHMKLAAKVSQKGVEIIDETFLRSELLPAKYRDSIMPNHVFVLHCKDYCYGYVVLQNADISGCKQLVKPLIFSIGNALDRIRVFSENQTVKKLREQTYIDDMTQIPNRRYMEHFIRKLYERLVRTGQTFCVMSIDMDGLKFINDTYGHLEGDNAICAAAKLLDSVKPTNGMAARVGGDEYSMLFPTQNATEAEEVSAKIEAAIAAYNETSGKPYQLSVSIGYEFCQQGTELLNCVHNADKKMYESKRLKKNSRLGQSTE